MNASLYICLPSTLASGKEKEVVQNVLLQWAINVIPRG